MSLRKRQFSSRSRSDAAQFQLKIPFDVDLDESREQSCAHHLLERLAVARDKRNGNYRHGARTNDAVNAARLIGLLARLARD